MCRQACNGAYCEHTHATVVGSQQRMRNCHQVRRDSQDCKKSCATREEDNRAVVQLQRARDDIFCGRVGGGMSEGPHVKLTGSGSEVDVPLSTAKNRALLRPRLSPLKASGKRRLARAAPRQILRCVHASNERAVSSGGPNLHC